ncbi:Hypothetical protein PBC10988_12680 [Planctomycetales bacterium 10988]|nr:Hypothetical protein PBC10988_12680 [Planctomycetales bacterium 10988]
MKITRVTPIPLARRLERVQRNSKMQRDRRRFTFVVVETDTGLQGIGDAYGDQELVVPLLERRVGPAAIGLDPRQPEAVFQQLFTARPFWETAGSMICCMSAIEVACWDILGQYEGVPVYELLGGKQREWIPAYASDLHWEEAGRMAEKAGQYKDQGFSAVKTHIGAPGQGEADLKRIAAMRAAIGPDCGLMLDVNTAWNHDWQLALEYGQAWSEWNPFWLEEPLCPVDIQSHVKLRNALPYPLATGENLYLTFGYESLFREMACDYVLPDVLRCGGLGQMRTICRNAVAHGITPTPHNYSSGVGLAATLHLMAAETGIELLEYDPTGTAIYEELFLDPIEVDQGNVRVPDTPGLGVRLTPELIEKYKV